MSSLPLLAAFAATVVPLTAGAQNAPLAVYAASSLRAALTDVARLRSRAARAGHADLRRFGPVEAAHRSRRAAVAVPAGRTQRLRGAVADGQDDAFVICCTNAEQAHAELPALQVLAIAPEINVGAAYGIVVVQPAAPQARAFVDFPVRRRRPAHPAAPRLARA
jgi:ABC-type molybdate transport system substrate-binding protein